MFDWMLFPINEFLKFFKEDIYGFAHEAFAHFVEMSTLGMIEFTIWSVQFSWGVAKVIIIDLGLSNYLDQAWSMMGSDTISILAFFGIPEVVSILLTALITSYVLKFIPFSGK